MRNLGLAGDYVRERSGWNNSQGDYGEVEYEGTRDYIDSLYASIRGGQNVLECERVQQGAKWTLRARVAIGESPDDEAAIVNDVRMSVNRVQKDIFEPPTVFGLDLETLDAVRRAVDANTEEAYIEMVQLGLTNDDAWQLYKLAASGVKYRIVYQPVLFRTRTAPAGHQWPDHSQWVGEILSHGQLFQDAALQGLLNFYLPPTDNPIQFPAGSGNYFTYGWLKHEPWYDTAAGNRTVEYLEYEYGLWPLLLYSLAQ